MGSAETQLDVVHIGRGHCLGENCLGCDILREIVWSLCSGYELCHHC